MKTKHGSIRKKMLVSSLAMLLVSTMTLGMATYAWFSMGQTAEISGLSFTAQAASGMQISADGQNWSSSLSTAELTGKAGNELAVSLAPVSTAGGVTTGALNLYKVEGKNVVTAGNPATLDEAHPGAYYKFSFYVQNQMGSDQKFQLDLGAAVSAVSDQDSKETSKTIRVAFIQQGSAYTLGEITDGGTASVIWEPNAASHTTTAKNTRYATDASAVPLTTKVADNTTYAYKGFSAAAQDVTMTNGAYNSGTVVPAFDKNATVLDLGTIASDMIAKYTVYIYIEGQDVDCNNDVAGGGIDVKLGFKMAE